MFLTTRIHAAGRQSFMKRFTVRSILRWKTSGFRKQSKTLIEILFKYTAFSNQMIYLRASRLKPFYYAAKVNEPCETHLPLSRWGCFLNGSIAEQDRRKIIDMNDDSNGFPVCSTVSIHLKMYSISVYVEIYMSKRLQQERNGKKSYFPLDFPSFSELPR